MKTSFSFLLVLFCALELIHFAWSDQSPQIDSASVTISAGKPIGISDISERRKRDYFL